MPQRRCPSSLRICERTRELRFLITPVIRSASEANAGTITMRSFRHSWRSSPITAPVRGCNTPFTMDRVASMGPRVSGGTVQDGLARGYRVGIIASGDNHSGFPGVWGNGLVGVWAAELTREGLWQAFRSRRVYGVTGDRISLAFEVNGLGMGSVGKTAGIADMRAHIVGCHAIDRVELLRNERVLYTYCHSGIWDVPGGDGPIRLKMRIDFGWGPSGVLRPEDVQQDLAGAAQYRSRTADECTGMPEQLRPANRGAHRTRMQLAARDRAPAVSWCKGQRGRLGGWYELDEQASTDLRDRGVSDRSYSSRFRRRCGARAPWLRRARPTVRYRGSCGYRQVIWTKTMKSSGTTRTRPRYTLRSRSRAIPYLSTSSMDRHRRDGIGTDCASAS